METIKTYAKRGAGYTLGAGAVLLVAGLVASSLGMLPSDRGSTSASTALVGGRCSR